MPRTDRKCSRVSGDRNILSSTMGSAAGSPGTPCSLTDELCIFVLDIYWVSTGPEQEVRIVVIGRIDVLGAYFVASMSVAEVKD